MALAEAARFSTLLEADVACSALNAHGIAAQVFDRHFAANVWTNQFAIGGVRVMSPTEDIAAAVEFLRPAHTGEPDALRWGHARGAITWIPLALLAIWLGTEGWAVAAAKQKPTPLRIGVAALYCVFLIVVIAIGFSRL